MPSRSVLPASAALVPILFAAGATPAAGQLPGVPRLGVGFVANAPEELVGANAYLILPVAGGLGLYVDAKFDKDSPSRDDTFDGTRTAREVEDQVAGVQFIELRNSWRGFNVALVRPVNPALMLYGGVGYAERNRYREYRDPEEQLGLVGFFWVEAPEEQKTTINALFGAMLRIGPLVHFQTGFETAPRGFTVGASLRLPPR